MSALNIWLTDRSRYEVGTKHCRRHRYLSAHAGPHGYGWARKAQSIPQVTGTLIHAPITQILSYLKDADRLPSDAEVFTAIQVGVKEYERQVAARGLTVTADPSELTLRTREQLTLLEGLVWTWVRVALPAFFETWKVVEVEQEDVSVLGCTCGLGDNIGEAEDHDARECAGIGWMTRADCVAERRDTGTLGYHEIKTTSDVTMNWEAAWQYRVQLIAGALGAERRLGKPIDEVHIHALIKGKFQSEWNPDEGKATGPKYQNSPLVYAWCRPANPPLTKADWQLNYNYVDETGKRRRLTKDYLRTPLWEFDLWEGSGALSALDFWTRWIGIDALGKFYRSIGPIYRRDWAKVAFLTQLVGEETRWQDVCWKLYELGQTHAWASVEFQQALDELVPQTRGEACHSYFGDSCEMLKICERHPGWESPDGLLGYIPRRPHHQPELDQAIERGLLPPGEGAAEPTEE